jgi:hypothetical protein
MRSRCYVSLLLIVALAGVGVQSAQARTRKPYRKLAMLGDRSCSGLLNRGSFANVATESATVTGQVGASYSSSCVFAPPEEEGEPPHRGEGGGALQLAVYDRPDYEFRGRERNLALIGARSQEVYTPLNLEAGRRKIGDFAYAGLIFNENEKEVGVGGTLQVRNDVVFLEAEFPPGGDGSSDNEFDWIYERFAAVAGELCPRCR